LTVMDLSGIRVVNIVVLASLAGIFIWLLVRRKQYALLTGYILSIVLLYVAIVPMCMEFMPTFVLFHVFSIVLLLWDEKLESYMQYLFLIFGALTCYFDFLTTETLVFVVPMLIILCIRGRDGRLLTFRQSFFATVQYGLSWLFGYGIFFPIKWILASFAKEELTLGAAFAQAMSHTDFAGELDGLNAIWLDAVVAPIGRIFPFTFSQNGWLILTTAILIMMVYGLLWFQFRKEKVPGYAWIVLLVGFIPFARYLVLMSHTVVHGFMVFRAQLGTFMALTAFMANAAQLHKPKKIKAAVHHKKGKRK